VLVTLKGFGGIWEKRLRNNPDVRDAAARAAFYNTTGVLVDGKVCYRWRIGGKIRFNGIGGFTPTNPVHSLNRVFECKDPETTRDGWTQVMFQRKLTGPVRPDLYLFVVAIEQTGHIDVRSSWKAESVQVVALSEAGDHQEAMLLMPAYSWVRGALGTFYVEPSTKQLWSAELRLGRAGLGQ
jgi:hypothetical protein